MVIFTQFDSKDLSLFSSFPSAPEKVSEETGSLLYEIAVILCALSHTYMLHFARQRLSSISDVVKSISRIVSWF